MMNDTLQADDDYDNDNADDDAENNDGQSHSCCFYIAKCGFHARI